MLIQLIICSFNVIKLINLVNNKMYNSETPIDIHCAKLVDWLVQRRHCRKDWGENLASIRRKIKAALRDMPESEEIKQLLIGSKLDYFKSKRIVEVLKMTEADSKNIFGYYSSQRMKDWQDIVYCYERDYVFLAETATDLIRETSYEIPGIRKVIQRLQREKDDMEKEKANLLRRSQQFNSEHQKLAQSYGIKGVNVILELNEQSKNLTDVMNEMVELAKDLKPGLKFYREYASSTSKQDASTFVSTLHHIITKGNTTVYEWRCGEPPESILAEEKAASSIGTSENDLGNDEIDFGDDLPSSSESSSGFVHLVSTEANNEDTFVEVEEVCDSSGKIARGNDAKLVLQFRKSRNQFLNNLYELEAFFKQFSNDDQVASVNFDSNDVNEVTSKVRQLIDIINKEKNRVLFQMNDSPTFIENINERFAAKAKQASDCSIKADLLDDKIKNLELQIRETELHLKRSIGNAKELQGKVENSISELYKGRTINIMGCVN